MLNVRSGLDRVLEATIVGSWSRVGFSARRHLFGWEGEPPGSLLGRVVVVTGGTSGIGKALAAACARAGATVILVGRDQHRTESTAAAIAASARGTSVIGEAADIGNTDQVNRLAERLSGRFESLHALVHGAGLLSATQATMSDGTELTAAVHVLGPHLLTTRLVPLLERGAPAAVVWVSSGGMYAQRLDVEYMDSVSLEHYRGTIAYARAKRAQVVLARLWNERLMDRGVTCFAMHPGWVDTPALRDGLPRFANVMRPVLRRAEEGADTAIWLASGHASKDARPGIWLDRRLRPLYRWPVKGEVPGEAERLWDWCEVRAGLAS